MKRLVLLTCLHFFVFGLGDENRMTFENYEVLSVSTDLLPNHLHDKVDVWKKRSFGNESTYDCMVSNQNKKIVKKFLKSKGIPFKVIVSDVQDLINSQQPSQRRSTVSKRSTRHFIRDFVSIVSHGTKTLIRTGKYESENELKRRADYPYKRVALQENDPELVLLDQRYPQMNWIEYHSLETIYSYMRQLERQYPHLVKIVNIGKTHEERPILLAKISKKSPGSNIIKPVVFIEGGIHAREWISPATTTYILNELVENSERNADILEIYDFFIVPIVNPDGYEYSQRINRMWRKNRSPNHGLGALLNPCWGVDLNRNFGYRWGTASVFNAVGGTRLPCLDTYTGPNSFSELESRAIRNFVMYHRKRIAVYISLHSYGEKVMYPWSHSTETLPDWQELHGVAATIAKGVADVSGKHYWVGSASDSQYISAGSSQDWARAIAGIKWVFLLELPDQDYGFLLPPSEILPVATSVFNGIRAGLFQIASTFVRYH